MPTRTLTALAAALLLGTAAVACSTTTQVAPLKICTTGDYQPLTYRDPHTGTYTGIDIDMARDLATHLGRTPEFIPTTWPTLLPDLHNCDIAMGGISITPARSRQAAFTVPYLSDGKTPLTTTARTTDFQTIAQINTPAVRLIENPGGTNLAFARTHLPHATLTISPDNLHCFTQLLTHHADVMITDAIEAEYQASRNPGLAAVHPDHPFTSDHKAYLLPKQSPLRDQVNAWLTTALKDGTFAGFYRKALN